MHAALHYSSKEGTEAELLPVGAGFGAEMELPQRPVGVGRSYFAGS